jgi:cytochrome P450
VLGETFPWERGSFDPPPAYRWLRENQPVVRVRLTNGQPAWLVTAYDDVRSILADARVSADTNNPGYPFINPGLEHHEEGYRAFIHSDPPDHTVFRRLLANNFVVKRVEAMAPRIQRLVDDQVDHLLSLPQPADLVHEFALPIPSTVLSWILGVKAEDAPFFNQAAEDVLSDVHSGSEESLQRINAGVAALRSYIEGLVDERLELDVLPEDIIGQMVGAMKEGQVTRKEVVQSGASVTVAGHDTTASMVATGTLTLLRHPEQMERLRAHPELIPAAIEELLRYLTIVNLVVARVALEDIEIGGVTIPAGEGIIPLNFSADRDDARFPDAATFDIDRDARGHVAFGYGVHQCLGQPLARVELRIVFETLLRRVPTLRLAAPVEDLKFKVNAPVHGVAELPVAW